MLSFGEAFERHLARTFQQAVRARAVVENMPDVEASARAALAELPVASTHPAMGQLADALALTPDQVELVWCVVACSVDGRLVPHLEALGGVHARRGLSPSVFAILAELDDGSVARLAHWLASPNPLVRYGLLSVSDPASPAARAYVASPRLVSFLAGTDHDIAPLRIVRAPQPGALIHDARQRAKLAEIGAALATARDAVIVIEGPSGSGRTTAAACASDRAIVALDCARISRGELGEALVALRRECLVRPSLAVLANVDHLLGEEARDERRLVGDLIDGFAGGLVITTVGHGTDLGAARPLVRFEWDVADTEVRTRMWGVALADAGASATEDLTPLAHRYHCGPAAIRHAVTTVQLLDPGRTAFDEVTLAAGLRHNIAERLGGLARRVEVTQTWDDLVIAEDIVDLITALVARIRHSHQVLDRWGYRRKIARGAGVAALFSGPPGTGKTMVAGLVARELDLELYQVDLSKVTSKWIGETEKNLSRVFDGAEEGHALLLFDEADSLFAQRSSEMKSSNDRYANLEVNYLLQRVEAFAGITILTTNLDSALDPALKRRLASHIVFATPEEDERARLWERQTTTGNAPVARDVDHEDLARTFPQMTGANIRNAAISAAFLAAAEGTAEINHDHMIRAARAEYRSMGFMVTETVTQLSPKRRSL